MRMIICLFLYNTFIQILLNSVSYKRMLILVQNVSMILIKFIQIPLMQRYHFLNSRYLGITKVICHYRMNWLLNSRM